MNGHPPSPGRTRQGTQYAARITNIPTKNQSNSESDKDSSSSSEPDEEYQDSTSDSKVDKETPQNNTQEIKQIPKEKVDKTKKKMSSITIALNLIPEFSGSSKELPRFLACCKAAEQILKNDTGNEIKIEQILPTKLKGRAYDLFATKNLTELKDIEESFNEAFLDTRTFEQIRAEVINCHQKPGESIKSFSQSLETLLCDLNEVSRARLPDGTAKEVLEALNSSNEEFITWTFANNLRNHEIKLILKAGKFTKLSDAVSFALKESSMNLAAGGNYNSHPFSKNSSVNNSYKNNGPNGQNRQPLQKNSASCLFCGKLGHYAANCFARNNGKKEIDKPKTQSTPVKCGLCSKLGHVTANCYRNRENKNVFCAYCKTDDHDVVKCSRLERKIRSRKNSLSQDDDVNLSENENGSNASASQSTH